MTHAGSKAAVRAYLVLLALGLVGVVAALAQGAAVGSSLVVLDALTAALQVGELAGQTVTADRSLAVTLAGVLYGGITGELLLRWGLMSLLAWAFAWVVRRARPTGAGATRSAPAAARLRAP